MEKKKPKKPKRVVRRRKPEPLTPPPPLTPQDGVHAIRVNSLQDIQKLLGAQDKKRSCPDVMAATHACVCIPCKRRGVCAWEQMSEGAGCVHSFPIYCSLRFRDREETGQEEWAEVALRDWTNGLRKKYDIPELSDRIIVDKIDPKKVQKEIENAEKEGKRTDNQDSGPGPAGHSEGSQEHIHS